MTVTSKMNTVSQSALGRLGPGGLLYAANKLITVRRCFAQIQCLQSSTKSHDVQCVYRKQCYNSVCVLSTGRSAVQR